MAIEDRIDDNYVQDLCIGIHKAFEEFRAIYEENGVLGLSICSLTLDHIARSYFVDIERYRLFHDETEYIDEPKHAAFLTKWIVRMRPIKVHEEVYLRNEHKPEHIYANLTFAIEYGWSVIEVDPGKIDHDLWWLFLYSLNFRNMLDSTSLISEYESHLRIAGGDIWRKLKSEREI